MRGLARWNDLPIGSDEPTIRLQRADERWAARPNRRRGPLHSAGYQGRHARNGAASAHDGKPETLGTRDLNTTVRYRAAVSRLTDALTTNSVQTLDMIRVAAPVASAVARVWGWF